MWYYDGNLYRCCCRYSSNATATSKIKVCAKSFRVRDK